MPFSYVELNIEHAHDGTLLDQKDFVERLDLIPITSKRSSQKSHSFNEDEITLFRTNWAGNQTH